MYNVSRVIYAAIGSIAFLQIVSRLLVLQDDVLGLIFWIQAGIGILCLMAPIYTWHQRRQVRRLFRIFVDEGLAGELVDIVKSYNLHVTESGSCIPRGPCGFWVAEIGGKFAGCVGLSAHQNSLIKNYLLINLILKTFKLIRLLVVYAGSWLYRRTRIKVLPRNLWPPLLRMRETTSFMRSSLRPAYITKPLYTCIRSSGGR